MNRLFFCLAFLGSTLALKAQESHPSLQKGKFLLETNFSPFGNTATGIGYQKTESTTSIGVGASLGYFVFDKLVIKGGLGYGQSTTKIEFMEMSSIDIEVKSTFYNLGMKYYINNKFPFQLSYEGNKSGDIKNNYIVGQVGYAWFIKENLALEPNIRYGNGFKDSESYLGAGLGFSIHF